MPDEESSCRKETSSGCLANLFCCFFKKTPVLKKESTNIRYGKPKPLAQSQASKPIKIGGRGGGDGVTSPLLGSPNLLLSQKSSSINSVGGEQDLTKKFPPSFNNGC